MKHSRGFIGRLLTSTLSKSNSHRCGNSCFHINLSSFASKAGGANNNLKGSLFDSSGSTSSKLADKTGHKANSASRNDRRGDRFSPKPGQSIKLSDVGALQKSSSIYDQIGGDANGSGDDDDNDDDRSSGSGGGDYAFLQPPFKKLLVLDRGLRALRILKTCRRMGIKTVAVYSDDDSKYKYVKSADESLYIGDITPRKEGFDKEGLGRIIDRAKQTYNVDALFPSFGMGLQLARLDKNSLEDYKIPFIGFPMSCIDSINDISSIKQAARQSGFIVSKGFIDGSSCNSERLVIAASELGFPIALKSKSHSNKIVAIAYNSSEIKKILDESSLKCNTNDIYLERYITGGRTLDIQVLCDNQGGVAVFPERDSTIRLGGYSCLEESPCVTMTTKIRKGISEQIGKFCKLLKFSSSTGAIRIIEDSKGVYHFVDFRVDTHFESAEVLTDIDIVEQLLWLSKGKRLPEALSDYPSVPFEGALLTTRVIATSNILSNLAEGGGRCLTSYQEPAMIRDESSNKLMAVEPAVYEGMHLSSLSSPSQHSNEGQYLISVIFAKAKQRLAAIKLLEDAIDQYVIKGVNSNILALRSMCRVKSFRDNGRLHLDGTSVGDVVLTPAETLEMIAITALMHQYRLDLLCSADRYKFSMRGKASLPFQFVAKISSPPSSRLSTSTLSPTSPPLSSSTPSSTPQPPLPSTHNDIFEIEILRTIEECSIQITPVTSSKGRMRPEYIAIRSFDWMVGGSVCKTDLAIGTGLPAEFSAHSSKSGSNSHKNSIRSSSSDSPISSSSSSSSSSSTPVRERSLQLESFSPSMGYSVIFNGSQNIVALMSHLEFNSMKLINKAL